MKDASVVFAIVGVVYFLIGLVVAIAMAKFAHRHKDKIREDAGVVGLGAGLFWPAVVVMWAVAKLVKVLNRVAKL